MKMVNEDGEWKSHSQKKAYRRQDKKFLNWKRLLKAEPIDMTETSVVRAFTPILI